MELSRWSGLFRTTGIHLLPRLSGQTTVFPALSGWTTDGDVHMATISFAVDGNYAFTVDAMDEAIKMGNSRVFNVIILGIAAKNMDFPKEQWIEVIKKTVPPKTIDINVAAFEKGYELA